MKAMLYSALVGLVALNLGSNSCESDTSSDAELPPANTVDVTVHYDGLEDGMAIVGLFTECPPDSGPLAFAVNDNPVFPVELVMYNVPAGEYFVNAILDIGRNNPMMPGPEDLQSCGDHAIVVTDEEGAAIDVVLHDQ